MSTTRRSYAAAAILVSTLVALPSEAQATGSAPITPLFGLHFLAAALVAGLLEGAWFSHQSQLAPIPVIAALAASRTGTAAVLMFAYLPVFYGVFPLAVSSDRWAIFGCDPLILLASVPLFAAVQRRVLLSVTPAASGPAAWRNVLKTSAIALAGTVTLFAVAALVAARQ